MSIRLFDTQAQRDYQDELETYDARMKAANESGEWPANLRYPKPPEPMADSRDPGLDPGVASYAGAPVNLSSGAADLRSTDQVDLDGTSQSEVDGFGSRWSSTQGADDSPFKLKR